MQKASTYHDEYGKYVVKGNEKARIYKILKNLNPKGSILDLGCGNGFFSHFMATNFQNMTVTGYDGDEKYIKYAKNKYRLSNLSFECVRFENLDKESRPKFDYIIFSEVIEHLPNVNDILVKIKTNLCHKKTIFIVTTDNIFLLSNFIKEIYYSFLKPKISYQQWYKSEGRVFWWNHHLYTFDIRTLATTLKLAGFSTMSYYYENHIPALSSVTTFFLNTLGTVIPALRPKVVVVTEAE